MHQRAHDVAPGSLRPAGRSLRRLRKRWTYVGAWGEDVRLCAAAVHVGPAVQQFVAVERGGRVAERTVRRPGLVVVSRTAARGGGLDMRVEATGQAVEVVTPVDGLWTWTRKTPVRVVGTVEGRPFDAPGLVDETDGYHPRRTAWHWSAGASADGAVTWNLCSGVNDLAPFTESTVWVDGVPRQVDPGVFAADLSAVGDLRFRAEAERARSENLLVVRSSYRQPFGTFTGTLDGVPVTGRGVMEAHTALW